MGIQAPQIPRKDPDGLRWASVSFAHTLDDDESLTGTPTAVEIDTTDLTIANVQNSTAQMEINDETVAAGKAVRFTVDGGSANSIYEVKVTGYSNSTPSQVIVGYVRIEVS